MLNHIRRAYRSHVSRARKIARRFQFQPEVSQLEDRNAPGSLFGDPLSGQLALEPFPETQGQHHFTPLTLPRSWAPDPGTSEGAMPLAKPPALPTSPGNPGMGDFGPAPNPPGVRFYDEGGDEQTYLLRHVYMGDDAPPIPELAEPVYNDEKAYSLPWQIYATPDVWGPGFGGHVYTQTPPMGSPYEGEAPGGLGWDDRPLQITFTASGADLAVVTYGTDSWDISYPNEIQVHGLASDIYEQEGGTYLVPHTGESNITVTAQTEDDQIHTTNGLVDGITPVARTLTMPVPAPDYVDPEFVSSQNSMLPDTAPDPLDPPAQPPAAPQDQNISSGFKWNTLTQTGTVTEPYPVRNGAIDIKFRTFTVKTVNDTEIKLNEPLPLADQPAATRNYVTNNGRDISFNCHGFSFGAVKVKGPDNVERSFWIGDAAEVNKLLNDRMYRKIPLVSARRDDVVVIKAGDVPVHSMKLISARAAQVKGVLTLDPGSTVATKNGIMPLAGTGDPANAPTVDGTLQIIMKDKPYKLEVYRLFQ
jgi:hypothetical protein